MNYCYDFSLKIFFDSVREAKIVFQAVLPEMQARHFKRSTQKLRIKKNMLLVHISALDAIALKASINGFLKKIALANSILEVE